MSVDIYLSSQNAYSGIYMNKVRGGIFINMFMVENLYIFSLFILMYSFKTFKVDRRGLPFIYNLCLCLGLVLLIRIDYSEVNIINFVVPCLLFLVYSIGVMGESLVSFVYTIIVMILVILIDKGLYSVDSVDRVYIISIVLIVIMIELIGIKGGVLVPLVVMFIMYKISSYMLGTVCLVYGILDLYSVKVDKLGLYGFSYIFIVLYIVFNFIGSFSIWYSIILYSLLYIISIPYDKTIVEHLRGGISERK